MIVSADKEMRFYKSDNLKKWTYVSAFGRGYGMQPSQYECPDFVRLPVNGDMNNMKYVMLMNVNPGCLFGGSATEYFVGDFDGKEFRCLDDPVCQRHPDKAVQGCQRPASGAVALHQGRTILCGCRRGAGDKGVEERHKECARHEGRRL